MEAKSQLQVQTPIVPEVRHDELYEGILNSMGSEAGRLGLPTPPLEADFAALREWNTERVKAEMAQIIGDVPAPEGKTPTALFVVGHSASGKSTFINKIFLPDQQGAFFYINPDVLGQFFCGSHKTFVDMKKHNLMSGDAAALDSAHADLNGVRFKFVSQETMRQGKQAVLDSNTVPPVALDAWRQNGYDVRVAFVEASYQGSVEAADEKSKIESKVAHGLANDENRVRHGEHSNRSLITAQRLTDCRKAAAKLHSELGCEVSVYISSGAPGKAKRGYMRLGTVGSDDLPLDDEFGFLTPKEQPDGNWRSVATLSPAAEPPAEDAGDCSCPPGQADGLNEQQEGCATQQEGCATQQAEGCAVQQGGCELDNAPSGGCRTDVGCAAGGLGASTEASAAQPPSRRAAGAR